MAKIFKLNDYDWVAAETMDEAIEWYKNETGLSEEDAIDSPYEITEPNKLLITIERVNKDEAEYKRYEKLQEKYMEHEESSVFKVPADELLAVEWEGKPYLLCSTEY
ncbi:hypothetical protein MKY04_12715 [Lysinibacillus telephonicus]|uniref:hypothetical protein n=1 Tax=Lysinibacillus telephonicus TaxID=1714840 RepID=UPI0031FC676D